MSKPTPTLTRITKPRLARKPRDLGLLLNCLQYRVPVEERIDDAWIEAARQHCKMPVERLAELRGPKHARHWRRMLARRKARLRYFKSHGTLPEPGTPLIRGDIDRRKCVAAMREYWKVTRPQTLKARRKAERQSQDELLEMLRRL
jgi:hypothetical protein